LKLQNWEEWYREIRPAVGSQKLKLKIGCANFEFEFWPLRAALGPVSLHSSPPPQMYKNKIYFFL